MWIIVDKKESNRGDSLDCFHNFCIRALTLPIIIVKLY